MNSVVPLPLKSGINLCLIETDNHSSIDYYDRSSHVAESF
jgi:hypothetical protein